MLERWGAMTRWRTAGSSLKRKSRRREKKEKKEGGRKEIAAIRASLPPRLSRVCTAGGGGTTHGRSVGWSGGRTGVFFPTVCGPTDREAERRDGEDGEDGEDGG